MEKKAGKLKGSTCVHLFNFRSEFPNPWPTHTDASQTWVDLDKDRSKVRFGLSLWPCVMVHICPLPLMSFPKAFVMVYIY